MQRKKTRKETLTQPFLNKADIQKLLNVSYPKAKRIYDFADEIDREMQFRIEPTKVRLTSVCKVAGIDLKTLQRQVYESE